MPRRKRSQLSRDTSQARHVRARLNDESVDERMVRLSQVRASISASRVRENSTDREARLAEQSSRASRSRHRASSIENSQRLAEQRERTSRNRQYESSSQRAARLAEQRNRTNENRNNESSAERAERHTEQSIRAIRNRDQRRSNVTLAMSAFSYNYAFKYDECKDVIIGKMTMICTHCSAKKWPDEANGLCCANGKVFLPSLEPPPEPLKSLILGNHVLSKHFLDNVRKYNTLFQMTSFGAKQVREGNFMPTFKVQGQIYHLIGTLLPQANNNAQFLQIYFLADSDAIDTRSGMIPNLNRDLIEILQKILHERNRYVRSFKCNMEQLRATNIDDFKLIIHADQVPSNEHRGRYNAPTASEVAVLLIDEEKGPRDIVLHSRTGNLQRVSELHRGYDSLQYPIIFVNGEDGYNLEIPQRNNNNKKVSCMQFYSYLFMVHENSINQLLFFKSLLNQYAVDMMAKMLSERLNFIRRNQTKLRADNYIHLRDSLNRDGNVNAANIGQVVILPSSFTASPRYMLEKAQDAMTYVRHYGRPDLFITFTCNPQWAQITSELFDGQKPQDRHDIISRVFHLKMRKLKELLTKIEIFGQSRAIMMTVEWQKRGLPHCHLLLWLREKIQPDDIDKVISAEIPDKELDPVLHEIVFKNMIHGPCGELNPSSPCMKEGNCTKKYPRKFITETQTGEDGYPTYRRRNTENGGNTATLPVRGQTVMIDNRWVVPYCPVLSRIFNAHINVEYCHSVQAIKYICKYINKGTDQATATVENRNDEVQNYVNGHYISSSEAFWRIFEFPIHERFPTVQHLAVHLENNQRVYFTEENLQQRVENPPKTTLIAFFELCQSDPFAKTLLYCEVPTYYTWSNNKFTRRKRGADIPGWPGIKKDSALGRVYTVHPNHTECFHLRMLLHHVRGPTSFEHLKTIDGVVMETFQLTCLKLGLLESDIHWEETLNDAIISDTPKKLRELFGIILIFCQPSEPIALWEKFKEKLCEDILHTKRLRTHDDALPYSEDIFNEGLIQLERFLYELNEKTLNDFALPSPHTSLLHHLSVPVLHDTTLLNVFVSENLPKLVPDQRQAYDSVIESVNNNEGTLFFIDAPGGTGKTYLINLLLATVRSHGKNALAVASSGIAATLLNGGRTAHSTFKLPLNVSLNHDSVCSIRKNGKSGKLFQETALIVWDECTMTHRAHFEAVDRSLRDIRTCEKLMGGVTFVLAGDFRQTLPVIVRGTRADVVKSCLKSSSRLWNAIKTFNLRTNMRVVLGGGDAHFPEQLLLIGDGKIPNDNDFINIDPQIFKVAQHLQDLISHVYPDVENLIEKEFTWLCERAIVTPTNSATDEINDDILSKIPGVLKIYDSIDTVVNNYDVVNFPQEFLHKLNPSGLPPHSLNLKVGAPIILLRNLNPPKLCNGTRLQIITLHNNIIEAIILTGPATGEVAYIPRIPMIPTDLPFSFKRLQFPIKMSFAITINKSQGQTFSCVGVDLRRECFSHGQLYVALSRCGTPDNLCILLMSGNKTRNVVYREVL